MLFRVFSAFRATVGRNNNFDALRIFAAALVILSHSWDLPKQPGEPVVLLTQGAVNGGALGVWIFFFISGFLVTESYLRRGWWAFWEARTLRIYPALSAALVFSVLVGAAMTAIPWASYWSQEQTWSYVYKSLMMQIQHHVPGVSMPINGSLWTIPMEVTLYGVVALMGLVTLLRRAWVALFVLLALMAWFMVKPERVTLFPGVAATYALPAVLCFLLGMVFLVLRDRIPLHGAVVLLMLGALIATGRAYPPGNAYVCVALCYAVAWLAFHPHVRLRVPDRVGDISYGLYVYAFPIQQAIIYAKPDLDAALIFLLSFSLTAALAWLSWHLLEKRALTWKGRLFRRALPHQAATPAPPAP